MAVLPRITQTLRGVACEIEWDDEEPIWIARSLYDMRWLRPRLPHPGGDLMPTQLTLGAPIPIGDLLWPKTAAGDRLRRLYLDEGERVLCELPAQPEWWDGDRAPWE